ncbi:dimeric dihydrodiol dehydrogenase [Exophiala viscosa]|uniref:dimeric dihydrodiol dehydrogenase n=1 Tax=Exophiala viscosa TaxID=2486360 RepID=UPI00218CC356|nr:dimeric dihydrodiol dehydrogenase [Exophiala viscosa]
MSSNIPTCRWGIISTGMISSWFVADLILDRPDAKVKHIIQSIGASSVQKAQAFAFRHCPKSSPTINGSYEEVYADPNVDCVYIGTPISFHKKNCLDAIAAGKNVLCEKAFTINAQEAKEVFEAAQKKSVYVHEAMWLRHRPMIAKLRHLLYEDKVIGDVFRMSCDFFDRIDIPNLPETSRYKHPKLGAGTLLDIGIYPLTWAFLTLDPNPPDNAERPNVLAAQVHQHGVEVTSSILVQYPSSGRQGVITSTHMSNKPSNPICRVYGTKGYVDVTGEKPSHPHFFTVYKSKEDHQTFDQGQKYEFLHVGQGFIFEADNTALDIAAGRKESAIMPWKETMRVMELMDEIRKQGGTEYPQDHE